jgi:His/Glu/Gln/Arg/opine family amino acid ABC transporter permease subunit
MQSTVDILHVYGKDFILGLKVTVKLCLIVWSVGIIGGALLGFLGAQFRWLVGFPSKVISLLLAGVPILVFLFWLHYPLQMLLNVVIDPFITAATALSIINLFLVSDLVRGSIVDFPSQYIWAARVCGLNSKQTALKIQLPIILRQILPGLLLIQVTMLQATLFASLISVDEIFRVAQRINSQIYRPVQIYTALAVFFIAVSLPMYGVAHLLRVRFTRDLSEK